MQINGIGSNHNSNMHHVTNCRHNHSVSKKEGGAMMSSGSQQPELQQIPEQKPESDFSLTDWMKNMLSRGKKLLGQIWGSAEEGNVSGENPDGAGTQAVLTPLSVESVESAIAQSATTLSENPASAEDMHEPPKVIQAATAVQPAQTIAGNPYFSAVEDTGAQQQTMWQRIKIKFQNIAGYLTRQFSFSNSSSFHTKQENAKEELKKGRYGKDNLETDVWATDESHLMDSYNSKGEYSRLAGEMLPKGTRDIRG